MDNQSEQIDLEIVIKSFKVTNEDILIAYLKELWVVNLTLIIIIIGLFPKK